MISQTLINSIPLCSRCITHEVNAWIIDKRAELDPEVTSQVREELKTIKLTVGECVVCYNKLVSENSINNLLKIMEKNKVSEDIKNEFKKLFSYDEE